jgi:hypothetical protein
MPKTKYQFGQRAHQRLIVLHTTGRVDHYDVDIALRRLLQRARRHRRRVAAIAALVQLRADAARVHLNWLLLLLLLLLFSVVVVCLLFVCLFVCVVMCFSYSELFDCAGSKRVASRNQNIHFATTVD